MRVRALPFRYVQKVTLFCGYLIVRDNKHPIRAQCLKLSLPSVFVDEDVTSYI